MRYLKVKGVYTEDDIFEDKCFNRNKAIAAWCLKTRDKYNIKTAVETGTFVGNTTEFLVEAFNKVYTIDIFNEFVEKARARFSKFYDISCVCGNSLDMLESICKMINKDEIVLFFLDAHGNYVGDLINLGLRKDEGQSRKYYSEEFDSNLCPVRQEIEIISKHFKDKCVIIVDDVYNPHNTDSGHVNFGGVQLGYDFLKDVINQCFTSHEHNYICGYGLGWPKSVLLIEPGVQE